ncbi:MAG: hypothetical protein L0Y66_17830 [Myxococcaceae bacterium]|nr:hypothetical protein [Myxococcaceae bacterium]
MLRNPLVLVAAMALTLAGCAAGLGEPCSAEVSCPEGLHCSFPEVEGAPAATGVCDYALRQEGEACTVANECEESLTCSNHFTPGVRYGTCTPRLVDGSACSADRDCLSGHCEGTSGEAADGVCSPAS